MIKKYVIKSLQNLRYLSIYPDEHFFSKEIENATSFNSIEDAETYMTDVLFIEFPNSIYTIEPFYFTDKCEEFHKGFNIRN